MNKNETASNGTLNETVLNETVSNDTLNDVISQIYGKTDYSPTSMPKKNYITSDSLKLKPDDFLTIDISKANITPDNIDEPFVDKDFYNNEQFSMLPPDPSVKKRNPRFKHDNISAWNEKNQPKEDVKARALRRTLLIKSLCTSRCTTSQELKERFEKLFLVCLEYNFVPTVEALALSSGISSSQLREIELGKYHKNSGMAEIIANAKDMIATFEAELARDGEINSTVYIFRAKNFFGMSDKQEVIVTPNTGIQEPENIDNILKALPSFDD